MDFTAGVVRLDSNTTKTGEGRAFPFDALPELVALLREQRERTTAVERATGTIVPWVFHRNGQRIRSVHQAWRAACRRAATVERDGVTVTLRPPLLERVPHDFRRTAARNLIRAGVAQHVVMALCGWKTDAMFRRYAIVDERDLRDAVAKLASARAGVQQGHTGDQRTVTRSALPGA